MSDEHESAVAAWLDHPDTLREIAVIRSRFKHWDMFQVYSFALQMEMFVALNFYGGTKLDSTADPDELLRLVEDDEEEEEPWKRS